VAEEVMREKKVAGASADLRRLGQFDLRISGGLCERFRAAPCEEGGMSLMRAGPDPEVAAVLRQLIVEEQAREKGERVRDELAGLVTVDVGPTRAVVIGRDVQRDLSLLKGEVDAVVPYQVSSEPQDASRPLEHTEKTW
jgi:hypothetical protein